MKKRIALTTLTLLVLVGARYLSAQDENADKRTSAEEQYSTLVKEFETAMEKSVALFLKAVTEEEKKQMEKLMPDIDGYVSKIVELAEDNPHDRFVADAWIEVFSRTWYKKSSEAREKALKALIKDYLHSAKLEKLHLMSLYRSQDELSLQFIHAILEKTPHRRVKGIITLALAERHVDRKGSDDYSPEKALVLFREVLRNYSDIEIEDVNKKQITLGEIAQKYVHSLTQLALGQKAPEIVSKDLDGNVVRLSDYNGKVVILDIWATWCEPCIEMIPHERKLVRRLRGKPFEFIGISVDKEIATVRKFQRKESMPWTHWYNGDQDGILDDWNIIAFPTLIILDRNGVIRYRLEGKVSDEELDRAVDALIAEVELN